MTAPIPRRTAVHEAGHAVSAVVLGVPIRHATVRRSRIYNGGVQLAGRVAPFPFAMIAGSGMAAEMAVYQLDTAPADNFLGSIHDLREIEELRSAGVNVDLAMALAGSLYRNERVAELVQHVAGLLLAPKPLRRIGGEEIEAAVVERLQLADERSQRRDLARSALIELTGRAA